jgi:hypothetical protein
MGDTINPVPHAFSKYAGNSGKSVAHPLCIRDEDP